MALVETIENRWDILYRDYPHVYEEFCSVPHSPQVLSVVANEFGLIGKEIVDIGCGSGNSTFQLARLAKRVIGVEPEKAMLDLAYSLAREKALPNVEFIEGTAQNIPLSAKSVDALTAVTTVFYPPEEMLPPFILEAQRVVRSGGPILLVNIAPGWYGGDLHDVIDDKSPDLWNLDRILAENGFDYRDIDSIQDYGSMHKILRTYGFIFGRCAIEYIKHNRKTKVLWRNRLRFKII